MRAVRRLRRVGALAVVVGAWACLPAEGGPPRAGDPLPEILALELTGDTVSTDVYRGKGVLLNLWATWCPPCRAEMPYLQELAERYADRGLEVVGISVDDPGARDLIVEFLEVSGVEYPILLDPGMVSMDQLGVLGLPATFLVDPEGVVQHVRTGPIAEGDTVFLAQLEGILPAAGEARAGGGG